MRAALQHPPILACLINNLETLPNILRLARCDRWLYERASAHLPELAMMRETPPATEDWKSVTILFLVGPRLPHHIIWRHACERTLYYKQVSLDSMLASTIDRLVEKLFTHSGFTLLEQLLGHVTRWMRITSICSFDRERGAVHLTQMPEIQLLWSKIIVQAIRYNNEHWLHLASASLFAYTQNEELFGVSWLKRAERPDVNSHEMWKGYNIWHLRVLQQTVKREAQEKRNYEFICQLLKHK